MKVRQINQSDISGGGAVSSPSKSEIIEGVPTTRAKMVSEVKE